jgi:hypothetical protein
VLLETAEICGRGNDRDLRIRAGEELFLIISL